MSLLMCSFLFIAALSGVLSDKSDAETVKEIIAASNEFFKENNLTEVSLGGFYNKPIHFNEGRISSLDTLELQEDPVIVEKEEKDGVRYDYQVKLALKDMNIKYQYEAELVEPIVHPKGTFSMKVGKNSFYADGHFSLGNDGSCSAFLNDVYVIALDDYEVHLNPKDVKIPALRRYLEVIINQVVHDKIATVVSLNIQGTKISKTFKENFSNIVCSQLTKLI